MTIAYSKQRTTSGRTPQWLGVLGTTRGKLLLVISAAVFVVLYVYQTSILATRTFAINELQQELRVLEQQQGQLDVQIAEERALHRIEERIAGKAYVASSQISYVTGPGTTVAKR